MAYSKNIKKKRNPAKVSELMGVIKSIKKY